MQTSKPQDPDCLALDSAELARRAGEASSFLKAISHEGRLMILCHLASGECTVGALEEALGLRQSAVSQQLARLREDGLVHTRRKGKQVYYSILDPRARRLVLLVHEMFCAPPQGQAAAPA